MKERNFVEQVIQANHSAAARLTGAAGNSSFRLPSIVPVGPVQKLGHTESLV